MYIKIKNNYIESFTLYKMKPETEDIYIDHSMLDIHYFSKNFILYTEHLGEIKITRRYMSPKEFIIKQDSDDISRYYLANYRAIDINHDKPYIILRDEVERIKFMDYFILEDSGNFTLKKEAKNMLGGWSNDRINFTT